MKLEHTGTRVKFCNSAFYSIQNKFLLEILISFIKSIMNEIYVFLWCLKILKLGFSKEVQIDFLGFTKISESFLKA